MAGTHASGVLNLAQPGRQARFGSPCAAYRCRCRACFLHAGARMLTAAMIHFPIVPTHLRFGLRDHEAKATHIPGGCGEESLTARRCSASQWRRGGRARPRASLGGISTEWCASKLCLCLLRELPAYMCSDPAHYLALTAESASSIDSRWRRLGRADSKCTRQRA